MLDKLHALLDTEFAKLPNSPELAEIKSEIWLDLEARYNDLIAEGKPEREAYNLTAAGIGDLDELTGELTNELTAPRPSYSSEGGSAVNPSDVHHIKLEWIAGAVKILSSDSDRITFSEIHLPNDYSDPLYWTLNNGTLTIKYAKIESVFRYNFLNFRKLKGKDITLTLPKGLRLESFSVNSVNGGVSADGLGWSAERVNLDTVNGVIAAANIAAAKLSLNGVNGSFTVSSPDCGSIAAGTVNGGLTISSPENCKSISMSSVNGNLTLKASDFYKGFTAKLTSVNGGITSDLPVIVKSKKHYVCGDGNAKIKLDTVNGSIAIVRL
jgi:DUF4097 and DUF4098 domain-containing protein YvlB